MVRCLAEAAASNDESFTIRVHAMNMDVDLDAQNEEIAAKYGVFLMAHTINKRKARICEKAPRYNQIIPFAPASFVSLTHSGQHGREGLDDDGAATCCSAQQCARCEQSRLEHHERRIEQQEQRVQETRELKRGGKAQESDHVRRSTHSLTRF